MPESEDVKKLQERIAELEQQLDEERQEMEWDLKAAREASAANIRKLEQELEQVKKSSPASGKMSSSNDDAALQRALMAERKVAELQQELKRVRESAPKMSVPNGDQVMRQRAESAEKERDDLRRQNRTLERTLAEKERALGRAENKAENTAELKRKMEEVRRDFMAKERELSKLKQKINQDKQGDEDIEQLRKQLADALSQLDEKNETLGFSQARVRELADEMSFLKEQNALMEKEKQDLKASKEDLRQKVGSNKQAATRQSELEEQVASLEQELARLKMASSQMLEQREREAERLKTDLSDIQAGKTKDSKRASELEVKHKSLERELSLARTERDEAVSALRRFREGESTVVSRPGVATSKQGADPFDENTKRVTLSSLPGADRSLDSTQPNMPSVSEDAESQAVIPGELIAEDSDSDVFPEASDPDIPKLAEDQAAGLRGKEKFSSKSTHPGEPPPLGPQEESLPEDDASENLGKEESGGEGESAFEGPESSSDEGAGDVEKEKKKEEKEDKGSAEAPESDELMVEWMGEDGKESAPSPAVQSDVPAPKPDDSRKSLPGFVKWGLIGTGGLAGVALIIVGALYFFPRWFGTQGVELGKGSEDSSVVDSSVVSADEASDSVDGGAEVLATGGDLSLVDGGVGAEASAEQDKADENKIKGSDEGTEEQKPVHRTPKQEAALRAAQAHGLKLLKKRKYKLALRFLEPWVSRAADDPVLRYLYGRSLFYRKKLKKAKAQMEKAVELKSDYADAWYELIGIYARLKERSQTRDAMERFLRLVPKNDRRAKGVTAGLKKIERVP